MKSECIICHTIYNRRPSQKGKYCSRLCYYKSMIGNLRSEETKKKIGLKNSIANKGKIPWNKNLKGYGKGRIVSLETREKMSKSQTGKIRSLETRKKLSISHLGKVSGKKGKTLSDETRIKISLSLGGTGNLRKINKGYPPKFNKELKMKIFQRDNFTCNHPDCLIYGGDLTVHHIDYNKQNCSKINLVTLCRSHNSKVNANRQYWLKYFKGINN